MLNILIAGVGGQGTLLASRVLGEYARIKGYDCKLSEVHGMAQRGGSVVTHVRIGDKVNSPVIEAGGADIIIAFEELEALRVRHYLKEGGIMLINSQKIMPMPVITGKQNYPENIVSGLIADGVKAISINAAEIAQNCGNIKAANIVMIGKMSILTGISLDDMKEVITNTVPKKFLDINLCALQAGYEV
ncbi:MAG: indolepyruvate oxidoreductase subunit beta [Christensenellales bacterium]|jgi:indolepyruvate ferredoxin oxidoreductase beta subunit